MFCTKQVHTVSSSQLKPFQRPPDYSERYVNVEIKKVLKYRDHGCKEKKLLCCFEYSKISWIPFVETPLSICGSSPDILPMEGGGERIPLVPVNYETMIGLLKTMCSFFFNFSMESSSDLEKAISEAIQELPEKVTFLGGEEECGLLGFSRTRSMFSKNFSVRVISSYLKEINFRGNFFSVIRGDEISFLEVNCILLGCFWSIVLFCNISNIFRGFDL